jgi:putative transcriptional regulator
MSIKSLAPGLLLAGPRLGDPNFEHAVVLLGRHEPEGSLGWIINGRAMSPVAELLRGSGLVPAGTTLPASPAFELAARVGGPVSTETGWVLYRRSLAQPLPGEIDAGNELAVTGDASALAAILRGEAPQDFRLVVGYAGWGPGQLEAEVRAGSWLPTPVDASLVFDTDPEQLWDAAYRQLIGAAPSAFTTTRRGSA